jgi:hypothetical protein
MTAIAISGMGLTGVLRLTWVQDNLAHVLEHSEADETSGTWTNPRVLHQLGEKPQVSRSWQDRNSVPRLRAAAV